jgi:type IV pilus assembly protein PilX
MKAIALSRARRLAPQRGVALILSLILLAVMTTFALLGVRLIANEERQVGMAYDRTLTLQAADAALREVEQMLETVKPEPAAGAACTSYPDGSKAVVVCPPPLPASAPRWTVSTQAWTTATTVGTSTLALQPSYVAEYLGNTYPCSLDPAATPASDCKRYRITARSGGASGRARVVVQSIYSPAL